MVVVGVVVGCNVVTVVTEALVVGRLADGGTASTPPRSEPLSVEHPARARTTAMTRKDSRSLIDESL
jgi:hypothetical protein